MKPYYERDGITIYCGDCREILPTLSVVDLLVTDPPYGLSVPGVASSGPSGTRNFDFFKSDSTVDGLAHVDTLIGLASQALAPSGSVYAWLGHLQFARAVTAYEALGWKTRFLVWARKCPPPPCPGAGWPAGATLCLYAYRAGRTWTHTSMTAPATNVITADSYRHGQPGKNGHPTQMNPALVAPLIVASSNPGDIVLDPWCGSGTTLEAARDAGRRAVGIEIEERYCEIAAKRLAQGVLSFDG